MLNYGLLEDVEADADRLNMEHLAKQAIATGRSTQIVSEMRSCRQRVQCLFFWTLDEMIAQNSNIRIEK